DCLVIYWIHEVQSQKKTGVLCKQLRYFYNKTDVSSPVLYKGRVRELAVQSFSMLQRYLTGSVNYIFVIGISITLLLVASCGTHHAAQVSDRDPPPSRRIPVHYVSRGETLYSIAWRYGIDYRELAQGNRISPPCTIYPGQKLYLFAQKTQPSRTTVGHSAPKKEPAERTPRQPQKVPPMATKTPPGQVQRPPVKITQPARLPPPRVVPRSESKATASAKQTLPPSV